MNKDRLTMSATKL